MVKYHLNPDSGRVGICKAEKRCPLIDAIHGETKEEARRNYEHTMQSRQFPILKKEKPFEPKPIGSIEELEVASGGRKEFNYEPGIQEILWFKHNGEVIGYAKISRRKVWWKEDKQELPLDKQAKPEDTTKFFTTIADFQVRAPGMGHGRKILEKLKDTYGDIFTTGGATPEGAKFLLANKDIFKQDPGYSSGHMGKFVNLSDPEFESTFSSMGFVDDWDNSRSSFPL